MSYQQITNIEDLPSLEDLETGVGRTAPMDRAITDRPAGPNIEKYIRDHATADPRSGMRMEPYNGGQGTYNNQGYGSANHGMQYATLQPREMYASPEQRVIPAGPPQVDPMSYNCIDIARHVQNCPICSRFYNNDKTAYVIAIVVLAIVCLLLLKRVLNV